MGLGTLGFPHGTRIFPACRKVVWDLKPRRREMGIVFFVVLRVLVMVRVAVFEMGLTCFSYLLRGDSLSTHMLLAEE